MYRVNKLSNQAGTKVSQVSKQVGNKISQVSKQVGNQIGRNRTQIIIICIFLFIILYPLIFSIESFNNYKKSQLNY
jgi:tetrahydromethanopterin S-methyltransferase subunit G